MEQKIIGLISLQLSRTSMKLETALTRNGEAKEERNEEAKKKEEKKRRKKKKKPHHSFFFVSIAVLAPP